MPKALTLEKQLLHAARNGKDTEVLRLLNTGLSPNVTDTCNVSALHWAVEGSQGPITENKEKRYTNIVKELLRQGASVNIESRDGQELYQLACNGDNPKIKDTLSYYVRRELCMPPSPSSEEESVNLSWTGRESDRRDTAVSPDSRQL